MKPRLHRLERLYIDHPLYFVTACTYRRQRLFEDQNVHRAFVQFCSRGVEQGCRVGRYVLMPDHVHVFVSFSKADISSLNRLSGWVKALKGCLSMIWRLQKKASPYWQKGFFDHIIRSGESYAEKWRYVVENPVRAGLVHNWEKWPYQGEICRLEL